MNQFIKQTSTCATVLLSVSLLSACEGESRPFEEAAEIQALDVVELSVLPPPREDIASVVINRNQTLQMSVTGKNREGDDIEIGSNDRVWSSSNPDSVSINDNGMITGGVDGSAMVKINIGGIEGELAVSVLDTPLTLIKSIDGKKVIERCLPEQYFATGVYGGDDRPLYDVSFSLKEGSAATLTTLDGGGTQLNATSLEGATLIASAPNAPDIEEPLSVSNTLSQIVISPRVVTVPADGTVDMTATGTYSENPAPVAEPEPDAPAAPTGASETKDITQNVLWSLSTGATFADVSNSGSNKGEVSGKEEGTATVVASCGELNAEGVVVTVTAASAANSTQLVFNIDNPLTLDVGEDANLTVKRGRAFDGGADVALSDLTFSATPSGIIDLESLSDGDIEAVAEGTTTVTVTRAESGNSPEATGTFRVTVRGASSL